MRYIENKELLKISLPTLDVAQVTRLSGQLGDVLRAVPEEPMGVDAFQKVCGDVCRVLGMANADAITAALSPLTVRGKVNIPFLSARLAGNVVDLRAGRPVSFDPRSAPTGWCMLRVCETQRRLSVDGLRQVKVTSEVLTGAWSGSEVSYVVTEKTLKFIYSRIGYSWRVKALHSAGMSGLVGLWFCGKVSVSDREGMAPVVVDWAVPPKLLAINRKVIRGRSSEPCPKGRLTCISCDLGYDECPMAVRQKTMRVMECPECRTLVLMDLRHPEACFRCRSKENVI